jgi:hypothetical protein
MYASPSSPNRTGETRSRGLLYEEILFEQLQIPREAYEDDSHVEVIRDRLLSAADAMRGELNEFTGINACIHVASSTILLESDKMELRQTLFQLADQFRGIDPTTIVTAASLYHMIKILESREDLQASDKKKIQHLRKRFGEIAWLVGAKRAKKLGFD